jgi:hypothetical protein
MKVSGVWPLSRIVSSASLNSPGIASWYIRAPRLVDSLALRIGDGKSSTTPATVSQGCGSLLRL